MAIKTISQLDQFNNGDTTREVWNVGGKLCIYQDNNSHGKKPGHDEAKIKEPHGAELIETTDNFSYSLIEISQPQLPNSQIASNEYYYSKHVRYVDLLKNVASDVKKYLNNHNGLFNNNIESIAYDNFDFTGKKTFTAGGLNNEGGVLILCGLTSDWNHISMGLTCESEFPAEFDCDISSNGNLTVDRNAVISGNETVYGDATIYGSEYVGKDLSVNSNYTIYSSFLSGYSYGLKDSHDITTSCGTKQLEIIKIGSTMGSITHGNPIYFTDGRPDPLSCVSQALYAYACVGLDGKKWNIGGNGKYVYFVDGQPLTSNTVDYATHAYWSDLGEKYLGDQKLDPGTLVCFGGDKEITIATKKVNAVVSTAAFDLNSKLKGGTVIALCGRVPTKVIGKVKKFDKIVLSNIPGVGRVKRWYEFWKKTVGISLHKKECYDIDLVECVVIANI